jgi:hypothetical protein
LPPAASNSPRTIPARLNASNFSSRLASLASKRAAPWRSARAGPGSGRDRS